MNTHRPAAKQPSPSGKLQAPIISETPVEGPSVEPVQLSIVPVDPHRVFVRWRVSPEGLDLAGLNREAAEARLALRFFRGGQSREEYPAESGSHEGFFSLREPGGTLTAGLIVKGRGTDFDLLTMTPPVTLPEPVSTLSPQRPSQKLIPAPPEPKSNPTVARKPENAAPPTDSGPREQPTSKSFLNEASIVAAAARLKDLPGALRQVPNASEPTEPPLAVYTEALRKEDSIRREPFRTAWSDLPQTPTLEEDTIVQSIRHHEAEVTAPGNDVAGVDEAGEDPTAGPAEPEPAATAPAEPEPAAAVGSSDRLASHFDAAIEGAPITLETTLRMTGRVAPGHRLRLGNSEVRVRADGGFYHQQRIASFATAWLLLQDLAATESLEAAPTLELLSALPEADASLVVHSTIEITGVLRDHTYRSLLPEGVAVDAAGCFRLVRSLPSGAIVLPNLVLVPRGPSI